MKNKAIDFIILVFIGMLNLVFIRFYFRYYADSAAGIMGIYFSTLVIPNLMYMLLVAICYLPRFFRKRKIFTIPFLIGISIGFIITNIPIYLLISCGEL